MPTKASEKSTARCGSGKFIAWIGFILAAFALAGVVVVVADKTTCGVAYVPQPTKQEPLSTPTRTSLSDGLYLDKVDTKIALLEKDIDGLRLEKNILEAYVKNIAAAPDNPAWIPQEAQIDGLSISYRIPPLPQVASRDGKTIAYDYDYRFGLEKVTISANEGMAQNCEIRRIGKVDVCVTDTWYHATGDTLVRKYVLPGKYQADNGWVNVPVHFDFEFMSPLGLGCEERPTSTRCAEMLKTFDTAIQKVLKTIEVTHQPDPTAG